MGRSGGFDTPSALNPSLTAGSQPKSGTSATPATRQSTMNIFGFILPFFHLQSLAQKHYNELRNKRIFLPK